MFELPGNTVRPGNRVSRRQLLQVGGLAPLGLSLPAMLAAREAHGATANRGEATGFGKAKRCLMLFLWGGPAHQDLWDMKPHAPDNIRGEFRPRASNVPGIQISELLPNLAGQMDKLALIRSVTHTDNNHSTGAHWMLTGQKHRLSAENFGASSKDSPHLGSVITKLLPTATDLPTFVSLPERIATTAGAVVPGQFAGWLGKKYDPFLIDQHPDLPGFKVPALALPEGIDRERVLGRANLRDVFNQARADLDQAVNVQAMHSYYERAASLVTSARAAQAFDLSAESDRDRDRYTRQTFGQSLLLARRLLESGVKLVTVYWHRDMPGVDTTWDTHAKNFSSLKDRLVPQVDQPIAALLEDLQQRGMLEDTLVVWTSEFGRTPKVNKNAGRDHWGRCNTIWMAGGGIPGGQVYGSSDKLAAEPDRDPVSPGDVAATILHQLGIDPHRMVLDREHRPHPAATGQPLAALIGGRTPTPGDLPYTEPEPQLAESPGQPNPALLADRPVVYWRLAEQGGSVARDEVEASDTHLAGAHPGKYESNTAENQRMQATVSLLAADKYSVEFCFLNRQPHQRSPITAYLFSRPGMVSVPGGEHIGLGGTYRAQGDILGRLFLANGHTQLIPGGTVLQLERWHHVVLTRDGQQVRLYLNGATDKPELAGESPPPAQPTKVTVATRCDAMFPLVGRMSDVALFDRVLSGKEIAAHFQASPAAS